MKSSARTRSFASRAACYEQLDVALDLPRRVRPLHLDDDLPAVRQHRAVHLADRRGRDRLLLELEEQPLDRLPELLADRALDVLERERAHVVLQRPELGDDVRRNDVGPGREQLAELHERRAELVEHLAQMTAARVIPRRRSDVPASGAMTLDRRSRTRAGPRPGRSRSGGRGSAASGGSQPCSKLAVGTSASATAAVNVAC